MLVSKTAASLWVLKRLCSVLYSQNQETLIQCCKFEWCDFIHWLALTDFSLVKSEPCIFHMSLRQLTMTDCTCEFFPSDPFFQCGVLTFCRHIHMFLCLHIFSLVTLAPSHIPKTRAVDWWLTLSVQNASVQLHYLQLHPQTAGTVRVQRLRGWEEAARVDWWTKWVTWWTVDWMAVRWVAVLTVWRLLVAADQICQTVQ